MKGFASARVVTRYTSDLIRPPRRKSPSAAAAEYLFTEKGRWDPTLSPEMIEPLDMLASREYTGVVFVGPARTGKTMSLILGGITYAVTCSPGDVLITSMSQDTARDFSLTDLDRAIRNSPALREALSPRAKDDNTYDKFFRSGMRLKVGWPSVSQLSSKTIRYVFVTDYDRPENRDNVDGEGPLWDLAAKRIETYMSRGKCFAESSPDAEYLDSKWKPSTAHEAPPARGILELYNRGTRARRYWPCQHCGEFFQVAPGLECFALPNIKELEERVRTDDLLKMATDMARVVCSHCGGLHEQRQRPKMSAGGIWLHDGQKIIDGKPVGEKRGTHIASYWLGGIGASFQSWESLILKYLQALAGYVRTGEESALKFTVNTDQGAAYLPRVALNRRSTDDLQKRLEDWPKATIPDGVRFLTAAVDVQSNRFIVHVMGWGVGLECWLIDRFKISTSRRREGDTVAALEPAAYLEDWELLVDQVMDRAYPAANRTMQPRLVMCDSGGKAGVTARAYSFYRKLRKDRKHFRFRLVKGSSRLEAATATLTWPDATHRKDRKEGGRGDVPVWMLNTNVLKDAVVGDLARVETGPGFVHLPLWLDDEFFAELSAEQRTDKGWKNPGNARNEAMDLHVYNRAACKVLKADKINWTKPPLWAAEVSAKEAEESADGADDPIIEPPQRKAFAAVMPRKGGFVTGWRR